MMTQRAMETLRFARALRYPQFNNKKAHSNEGCFLYSQSTLIELDRSCCKNEE